MTRGTDAETEVNQERSVCLSVVVVSIDASMHRLIDRFIGSSVHRFPLRTNRATRRARSVTFARPRVSFYSNRIRKSNPLSPRRRLNERLSRSRRETPLVPGASSLAIDVGIVRVLASADRDRRGRPRKRPYY